MEDRQVTIGKSLGAMVFFGASFACLSWFVRILYLQSAELSTLFAGAVFAIATGTLFGAGIFCVRFGVVRAAAGSVVVFGGLVGVLIVALMTLAIW